MITAIVPAGVSAVEVIGDNPDASLLPDEAAALGNVSEGRRREFTIARDCARRALVNLGFPPTPILPGPRREPLWPAGVVGSITHCPGYCAAAVAHRAHYAAIGIDAEVHDILPRDVLDMVALDDERSLLRALAGAGIFWDRVLFSAKESVYKAWFQIVGKWLDFKDVLVLIDPESGTFHAQLLIAGPLVDGRAVTGFHGRYLVDKWRILTAVSVNARQRAGELGTFSKD